MVFDWFQRRLTKTETAADPAAGPAEPQADAPAAEPTEPAAPETDSAAPTALTTESGAAEPVTLEEPPSAPLAPASPAPAAPPAPSPAGIDNDALAWAREAYARLKAEQQAARQAESAAASPATPPESESPPPVSAPESKPQVLEPAFQAPEPEHVLKPEPEAAPKPLALEPEAQASEPQQASKPAFQAPEPEPQAPEPAAAARPPEASPAAASLSLLERAAAERQQRQKELLAEPIEEAATAATTATGPAAPLAPGPVPAVAADESEPRLGDFDEAFTWSAEVLAAQGRRPDQVSLEEIDWLARLRRGLEKTRRGFVSQLLEKLGDDPLTPQVLDELESSLLRADVGVQATDQVIEALRARLNQEVVEASEGLRFLKEQLRDLLEEPIHSSGRELLSPERDRLNIWLLVGVNGVGKTTTLGKLANLAVRSGYSCLIAAADTFRAAAVEQVRIWGERSGVAVIANPSANADPAAVVFDAIGAAKANGTELVLVDTAGRLQTKHNLMEELSKVRRIVDKLAPEAAVESLLVLDASQGQNGLRQALAFARAAGLTGVVITKLDGSSRGGVALAVCREVGLPIRFIGAGEGLRDLRPFNSYEFVEALLAT